MADEELPDYLFSTFREKMLEHAFVGDLLRVLWKKGIYEVEVLTAEVDAAGYDIVMVANGTERYIQLKSSFTTARAASQNINRRLEEKPGGCVVWVRFDKQTLSLGPFHWLGDPSGGRLSLPDDLPLARHTKANAQGEKAHRRNTVKVSRGRFEQVDTLEQLAAILFPGV